MGDAFAVGRTERFDEGHGDREKLGERQPLARNDRREGSAPYQLHRDEVNAVDLFHRVDGHDAGVVEGRDRPRLLPESRQSLGVLRERVGQDLDRHLAVELRVDRLPHHTHPALADLLDEPVVQQHGPRRQLQDRALPEWFWNSKAELRGGVSLSVIFGCSRLLAPKHNGVVVQRN